jgi:hypothetical protein
MNPINHVAIIMDGNGGGVSNTINQGMQVIKLA